MSILPLFVIAPPADEEGAVGGLVKAGEARRFPSVSEFLTKEASNGSGCILIDPEVPDEEVRTLLASLAARRGPWTPVLLEWTESADDPGGARELRAHPLSLGYPEPVDVLLRRLDAADLEIDADAGTDDGTGARNGGGPNPPLELRTVVAQVSRIRHDINNPLTAALAEVQLLLMDLEDEALRDPLETVERQLGRIRDLVFHLSSVRAPVSQKAGEGAAADR